MPASLHGAKKHAIPSSESLKIPSAIDRARLGTPDLTYRQKLILFAICATYVTAVPLRQFLSSINPALKKDVDLNFTNELAGVMYVIAGIGYSAGKLIDGVLIDKFGAIGCFVLFQMITILGVWVFTLLSDIYHLSLVLAVNAFVQAGLWPALSKLIFEMFSPAQFGLAFACLGIASRLGSAYSKAVIGYLLYLDLGWRHSIRVICAIGLLGLIWFALWMSLFLRRDDRVAFAFPQYNQIKQVLTHGDRDQRARIKLEVARQLEVANADNPDTVDIADDALEESHALNLPEVGYNGDADHGRVGGVHENQDTVEQLRHEVAYNERTLFANESYPAKLKRFFSNGRFVLMCISSMFLTMVVGLDAFSELLLSDVISPSFPTLDTGVYVMTASAFPLGLTVALLVSYVWLREASRAWLANYVNVTLCVAVVFCLALLAWTATIELFGVVSVVMGLGSVGLLLFSYGYCLAYPYYVQTGVFALRFGGSDSGLVLSLIDFCGYLPSSALLIVGAYLSRFGWRYVLLLTLASVVASAVSFMYFNHRDLVHERKEQRVLADIVEADEVRAFEESQRPENRGLIGGGSEEESDESDVVRHESDM